MQHRPASAIPGNALHGPLCLLLALSLSLQGLARQIGEAAAARVARQFLSARLTADRQHVLSELRLAKTYASTATSQAGQAPETYFYVFNAGDAAFVIVSGDDSVEPILGYSTAGAFDPGDIPVNAAKWLEGYRNQVRFAIRQDMKPTPSIMGMWSGLQSDASAPNTLQPRTTGVNPLVAARWNQTNYYNALCPFDANYNQRTVTGCVATAMAQIMKYWSYPTKGSGFYSYNHVRYGTLSANFGGTTYEWASMTNTVNAPNAALATLMYHCGVSVDMNYNVAAEGGSGAYMSKVVTALTKYFGYAPTVKINSRTLQVTDADWKAMLKKELDAGRPIDYAGSGGGGGHSFVCDGYDDQGLYHMNWGWGGNSDGYFNLNALNPGALGTGGGTGGFNSGQQAITGIAPPTPPSGTYKLGLSANLVLSKDPLPYGNSFTVTTNITNSGNAGFSGDYCAAVFDDSLNFIDYVETKTGMALGAGNTYANNIVFSSSGLFSMLPGNYYVGIYYRPANGDWVAVSNGSGISNFKAVKVTNTNTISLNSKLTVNPGILVKGQAGSVNFNIINTGTTTFLGQYQAAIYKLDGSGVQTINSVADNTGLPANYTYTSPFITLANNAISADPGTYLLAVTHKPGSSTSWQLTGSGSFQNPIKVIVKMPSLAADAYESNNQLSQSSTLAVSFTGDSARVRTDAANCHTGSDYDFYRIQLPAGYTYTLTPRLQDEYDSNDGKTYTLDAVFSYSKDGTNWSDAIDDVADENVTMAGGTTIYFKVAPYFTGETGTYALDVKVKRAIVTGVYDQTLADKVRLGPNPVLGDAVLTVMPDRLLRSPQYTLSDMHGRLIYDRKVESGEARIPMGHLPSGVYYLRLYAEGKPVGAFRLVRQPR